MSLQSHDASDEEEIFGMCALCRRLETLTRHHLIPKSRQKKARMLRQYTRYEMRDRLMMICRPCHTNLHRSLSEQELGERYNTPELIAAHPDVAKFTRWIERKPSGFVPP
ncbi:MAG: hypothetical protein ACAI35_16795 [Candidatus Methylacidiphilales bacterium]